jgi:hypothetical protein
MYFQLASMKKLMEDRGRKKKIEEERIDRGG